MTPSRSRATRAGFTLLEILIASAISLVIMIVVYDSFMAGSRGMVRAENRLNYLMDSDLIFLSIRRDLHTAIAPPVIHAGSLEIPCYQASQSPFKLADHVVLYERRPDPSGGPTGAIVRRVTKGPPGPEGIEKHFGEGTVKDFSVTQKAISGKGALLVHLVFRSTHDAGDVVFDRLFVPQDIHLDPTWIPVR